MRNRAAPFWSRAGKSAALTLAFYLTLSNVAQAAGPPPVITVQPADQTVPSGGTVTFSVSATSSTTLSYQWYENGLLFLDRKLTGQISSNLVLSGVTDSGHYYVKVINGGGTVTSRSAALNVTVNTPPVARNDNYSTPEDVPLVIPATGILANDTDIDGQTLTSVLMTNVTPGSLILNSNGAFIYTPPADYFGNASFTYRVSDRYEVLSEQNSFGGGSIEILNEKGAQSFKHGTAGDASYMIKRAVVYLSRESSFGNENLAFSIGTGVNSGSIAGSAVAISGASITNISLGASFQTYGIDYSVPVGPFIAGTTYYLNFDNPKNKRVYFEYANANTYANGTFYEDGVNRSKDIRFQIYKTIMSNPATVSISVLPVNDAPIAVNDSTNTLEDVSVTINVLGNDTDVDSTVLTITSVSATNGTAVISGTNVIFTPAQDFNGLSVLNYTVSDGTNSASATVTVTVISVNDAPPVANNDFYTISEDATLMVSPDGILANDTDVDGDAIFALLLTNVSQGTLTFNSNGGFTYKPRANFYGTDTFAYRPRDGWSTGNVATVAINVAPVNDAAPVAFNDTYVTQEDVVLVQSVPGVLSNDTDEDDNELSAALVNNVSNGELNFNADGSFIYSPRPNYYGSDSFTYRITDGFDPVIMMLQQNISGGDKRELKDVEPGAQSFRHGVSGDFSYSITNVVLRLSRNSDTPNVHLNFSIGTGINSGPIPGSSFTVTRASITNLSEGSSFQDYVISFATPVGPLVAGTPYYLNFNYGSNGEKLYLESSSSSAYPNGTYYKDGSNENKDIRFQIYGITHSDVATVNINVTPINDPPLASDDSYRIQKNLPLTISAPGVLTNDLDIESDSLTAVLVSGVSHGTLSLNSAGSFTYTPSGDYVGEDTFTYRADDGFSTSTEATVKISVLDIPTLNVSPVTTTSEGFCLQLSVNSQFAYVIEASPNLKDWTPICTNSGGAGAVIFTDTEAGNFNHRFYRVIGR